MKNHFFAWLSKFVAITAALVCSVSLFAQSANSSDSAVEESNPMAVQFLIEAGLRENSMVIRETSSNLSSIQRQMLYSSNKKSAGLPFALNFLVGFGIGSFVQGDTTGGLIGGGGELASLGLFTIGLASDEGGVGMFGLVSYLGFRIFGAIRPFLFTNQYNHDLAAALNVYAISFNAVPVLTPEGVEEIALVTNIRL